ncbi:MAG: extracellular solute-binding protein [Limnochordia bacterium]
MSQKAISRWLTVIIVLSILVLPGYVMAERERIKLEVVMTAGRDPNENVVQDYEGISWTQVLTREFQKEYPYVDVIFRKGDTEQVIVSLIGGIGPDIVNAHGHKFINLGREGMFVDLAPLLKRDGVYDEVRESFWPPQFETFMHKGELFALPQYLGTVGIFYNADMFGYMGVVDPEPRADLNTMDWEAFEAIGRKVTQDLNGDGVPDIWGLTRGMTSTDRNHYWLKAGGAEFFENEEKTVSSLNSRGAIDALEYIQRLRWESQVIAPPGAPTDWLSGQCAMWEGGSWALVRFLGLKSDGSPKVPFEWNVFPMPIGPSGERYTLATNDGYAINKNTKHPEEAYALLKFLAGPVANEIKAKYLALQPAHRDIAPEYLDIMRELNTEAYDINAFVFTDAGPYALPEVIYADHMNGEAITKDAYVKIFDQNQPAGPIWSEAIERLNSVMASAPTGPVKRSIVWQGEDWTSQDFGTLLPGNAIVQEDGSIIVQAAGADIWGYQDGLGFVFQEIQGDFEAVVCLHSVPDTHGWSKSGIMLKTAATGEAPNIAILGTRDSGLVMQKRPALAEKTVQVKKTAWKNGEPIYLKLIRKGNKVTGQTSTDGETWTTLATEDIQLPESVFAGLASTSHAASTLGDALFSQWNVVLY